MRKLKSSYGTLKYGPGVKAYVSLNQDFANYYKALIPKYLYPQGTRYSPHITVVRLNIETPNIENWRIYENKRVWFSYNPIIRSDGVRYWLDVWSDEIARIRGKLGLEEYRKGFNCYHITIAKNGV